MPGSKIAWLGVFGVQMFFLLSAVTLLRSFDFRRSKERFPLRNFVIRRFFRIAPLFWFGIILYFFINGSGPGFWAPDGLGAFHYVSTALFLHAWAPTSINSVVPGGWSIGVEMLFYACLPFLAARINTRKRAWLAAAVALIISLALSHWLKRSLPDVIPAGHHHLIPPFLRFWFPAQLPVFLIGFALYRSLRDANTMEFFARPGRAAWAAAAVVIILGILAYTGTGPLPKAVGFSLVFLPLILALAAKPFQVMVNRFTCHLGLLSFSGYLMHFAALMVTANFFKSPQFDFLPAPYDALLHFATVWASALVMTVAASTITYRLIEKPGMSLGARLIARWETP